jgi:hypothetical protein
LSISWCATQKKPACGREMIAGTRLAELFQFDGRLSDQGWGCVVLGMHIEWV